ncbi:MAG: hypothetical protein NTW47_00715 [Proteobacteria bacterium]|nr:hypothetical protein [Pseudomonadota bacterium]
MKREIPPRGIVFANASTVAHQVIYGNRVVELDGFMPRATLYSPYGSEWDKVEGWIKTAGYSCVENQQAHAQGSRGPCRSINSARIIHAEIWHKISLE